jgi:hypothetical protein
MVRKEKEPIWPNSLIRLSEELAQSFSKDIFPSMESLQNPSALIVVVS